MGLSAVGVLVLIGVIYFFLNMATMGYYEWSLRIAGVVLAIVAVRLDPHGRAVRWKFDC